MRTLASDASGAIVLCEKTLECSRPGPQQVLVKVSACHIAGLTDNDFDGDHETSPKILTGQAVGKVSAVGDAVSRCAVGDFVLFFHDEACAEQVLVEESQIARKPHALDAALVAAALKPAVEVYTALYYKMRIEADDTVLITDPLSARGRFAAQLAAHHGAVPVMLAFTAQADEEAAINNTDSHAQTIEIPGFDAYGSSSTDMNASGLAWREWQTAALECVRECTSGLGFDHVLDCGLPIELSKPAGVQNLPDSRSHWLTFLCRALGMHGTLVTCEAKVDLDVEENMNLAARGASIGFVSFRAWTASPARRNRLLHIMDDILLKLDQAIIVADHPREESLANAARALNDPDAKNNNNDSRALVARIR
ncbi:Quinone oxidoreductase-like protein 1 [Hondaea fermentalgiana]|uniref:Quinone oxidoreductase-like protein 1 n=1 Tax=Hondaea fermentalgiana TaxID=2315210 RepID=A0A2R5GW35_9STRA|nr:Quinone oxidoreductase-like protein 1 [Hondaea fermentalgiana]|eukprot:GBG33978.1 Quinone oxidoreductase-like protein 1 [Hondaea fermentalgiana]